MPTREELKMLQALPLDIKIRKTQQRIREWVEYYGEDGVYVSFSGGKDSAVLLDIVRKMYPGIEAVFVNTGLEYPEIDPENGAYVDMHIEEGDVLWCECEECGSTAKSADTPEEAIANWNRRASNE